MAAKIDSSDGRDDKNVPKKEKDRHYGAVIDSSDGRDYKKEYSEEEIPPDGEVDSDLREYVDHVYDQGELGSSTANALCAAYGLDLKKQEQTLQEGFVYFDPSRLFLYYNTRERKNKTHEDAGASIRDAIKAFKCKGVCTEEEWPYYYSSFAEKPSENVYASAKGNTTCRYERLKQNVNQLRACLNNKCPFVFGFKVYQSCIDKAANKHIMTPPSSTPSSKDKPALHAVVAVGYNGEHKAFLILNSWGKEWGNNGYFFMSYDFIKDSDLCFDFWKISFACQQGK